MKNEIGRKITSLTIMTIMVAGGMSFAVPGMIPGAEAGHNQYLFVSAENAEFANTFGGLQVVEVVVRDPLNASTENGIPGAPKVEINGDKFAMVQGADGSWYGFTANGSSVTAGDSANTTSANGLEFGVTCTAGSSGTAITAVGLTDTSLFDDVDAVWVSVSDCTGASASDVTTVIGGAQGMSISGTTNAGNVGIDGNTANGSAGGSEDLSWPFVQVYDFSPGPVEICYLSSGADECVLLDYDDTDGFNSFSTDRSVYPPGAQVELEIRDVMLNIDPTATDDWTFDVGSETDANTTYTTQYTVFRADATSAATRAAITVADIGFSDGGILKLTFDSGSVLDLQDNADSVLAADKVNITETGTNTGVFTNVDDADVSNIFVKTDAPRGTSGVVNYNDTAMSILVGYHTASVDLDESAVGEEWNSGEELPIIFTDQDVNLNNTADEDILFSEEDVNFPTVHVGSPLLLNGSVTVSLYGGASAAATLDGSSGVAHITTVALGTDFTKGVAIETNVTAADFRAMAEALDSDGDSALDDEGASNAQRGAMFINYDVSGLVTDTDINVDIDISDGDGGGVITLLENKGQATIVDIHDSFSSGANLISAFDNGEISVAFYPDVVKGETGLAALAAKQAFYVDFFSFHPNGANNAVYRCQCEEGDPGVFEGDIEYRTINQNEADQFTDFPSRTHLASSLFMVATGDLTGVDAPRIQVSDTDSDGVSTPQADQVDLLTHSGTASFDSDIYKIADTVTVTITDMDLNTDSELVDVYKVHTTDLVADADSVVVEAGSAFSHIMEITFDDETWEANGCSGSTALDATGFTLVETDMGSGVFTGTFQVPSTYCNSSDVSKSTTATDMEVNYIDFYDASSNTIEVGAGAAIYAVTGSIALDADVYPVPFTGKTSGTFDATAEGAFADHAGTADATGSSGSGDVTIYVWVTDADFDQSPSGEDNIATNDADGSGPVHVKVYRSSDYKLIATAGGTTIGDNNIANADAQGNTVSTPEKGPMVEICPDCGVFELLMTVALADGPKTGSSATQKNINQGDVLTVEYTDPQDATGEASYLATDSATFDLRTGVLTTDKSVYVIGSDVVVSIIDPDLNLDNDSTETYDLDLIEWDSDAAEVDLDDASTGFDPEPNGLRETGSDTGVFQTVIEFPETVGSSSTAVDRGEKVTLEYTDYGPSGASFYADDTEDVTTEIYSSNFGATIELDQKVYSWTERVFITITAPDHNMDSALVDEIGGTTSDPITAATRDTKLSKYKLMETGADTGIFYGEITLNGFKHDADGDADTGDSSGNDKTCSAATPASGTVGGPTDGTLCAQDEDGVTISFEYTEDSTVIGSALVRWNIGEAEWLESSYSAGSSGTVRITDPDMDLNADYVDNFKVDVWSDSDSGGIDLTITETSEMSGVFEGTVYFTTTDESSGHRLRVSEGDTVTVEYEDNTLPNPYNTSDELEVAGTAIIGTITPPLERAPASNARVVDAFGNALSEVAVDQQVQIEADLVNGTDSDQSFAYLVQVQDGNGVTVSLAWITGSLSAGQSFSPALSWIPSDAGSYEATVFVWESVDNPSALSDTVSVSIDVV